MNTRSKRIVAIVACLAVAAVAGTQIMQAIKIIGVGAAVKQFGPDINKQFNSLTGHKDTDSNFTKVVPIITVGLNTRGAIGAAQVMGAKKNVQKVSAVAAPEVDIFGREIKIRALIPVENATNLKDPKSIKAVDGVGVSGVVDLKL
ncbi:MAG: hypothetical protein KIT11_07995 [Fimbriimonadaceae bacterium]|nr:hypothetical protein [Fimbriimonadaceae bacterium]QYK56295.1 MAG: hypothetical protein KF733_02190 [Fimbriimonadaceae bacterium]